MGLNETVKFPLLTTDRYLNAEQEAREAVKKRIKPPSEDQFRSTVVSHYPNWFVASILTALGLVLFFSFWVSSGKQAAASGLVFDHLPGKFNHLSEGWADFSILFMLFLSEMGSTLFLVASGTLAHSAPKATIRIKGQMLTVNPTQWVFRTFAILCASYAIVSNVVVTVQDQIEGIAGVLQWLISIGMPVTVLGLAIMLERVVIDRLRTSADRQARKMRAMQDYHTALESPEKHEYYPSVLLDAIYNEIMRYKKDREALGDTLELVQKDQQYRVWLVQAEYAAQQNTNQLIGDGSNPFLALPATTD